MFFIMKVATDCRDCPIVRTSLLFPPTCLDIMVAPCADAAAAAATDDDGVVESVYRQSRPASAAPASAAAAAVNRQGKN